jgi:hypothetical protein
MTTSHDFETLGGRLAQGQPPMREALELAVQLAEALRRLHATGQAHGRLNPGIVVLPTGEIQPAPAKDTTITPYLAPEVVQRRAPEPHSDVFSFGAILYELTTGRRAFGGETPQAIKRAILESDPPPTGNPELDSIVSRCLDKNPATRWQKMEQVLFELRLLAGSVRRREPRPESVDTNTRQSSGVSQPEPAVWEKLQKNEQAMTSALESFREEKNAALAELRKGIADMGELLAAAKQRGTQSEPRAERADGGSIQGIEDHTSELQQLRETVDSQGHAIEAAKKAMANTNDLVARAIEAIDALQNMVLELADAFPAKPKHKR